MTRDELMAMFDRGDTHGLLVAAARHHAEVKFGDDWRGGVVFISRTPGEDHEQIVFTRRPATPRDAAS